MTTDHLGLAHMEAATWQPRRPRYGPRRPWMSRRAWMAVTGRYVIFLALVVVLGGLAVFARPAPGRSHDPHGPGFRWTAIDPDTGRDVPRAEWLDKALAV